MSKVCRLWYKVEQPWSIEGGFEKKLVGIYTSKHLMLQNIDTCIQNLINQLDTDGYRYEVMKDNAFVMLRTTKQYDLWNTDKRSCLHCFTWDRVELDTVNIEDVKLSSYIDNN